MRKIIIFLVITSSLFTSLVSADTFGTGANQFEIEFVPISGDASSANGTNISQYSSLESGYYTFADPGNYRIGKYEITRDQWYKFAFGTSSTSQPARYVSWFEVAQFINYLNTNTGHQAAYKFVSGDLAVWEAGDEGYDPSNPYRNSNAYYFLPTEDEWVKAAYWNGTNLQTYATPDNSLPLGGVEANYEYAIGTYWDIGSGSEELNGTFDMMGNVWEWMENAYSDGSSLPGSDCLIRGGCYGYAGGITPDVYLSSSYRQYTFGGPDRKTTAIGFRVASVIPEPTTFSLLALGAFFAGRRRK